MKSMYALEPQLPSVMASIHVELARHPSSSEIATRRAGVRQQGWLGSQSGRLLGHLGNRLVAWGERLEQYEPARSSV